MAKRIHGLNLLQTKVFTWFSPDLNVLTFNSFRVTAEREDQMRKGKSCLHLAAVVAVVGQWRHSVPSIPFLKVLNLIENKSSQHPKMDDANVSMQFGNKHSIPELMNSSPDAPYYSPNKLLNKLYEERVSRYLYNYTLT